MLIQPEQEAAPRKRGLSRQPCVKDLGRVPSAATTVPPRREVVWKEVSATPKKAFPVRNGLATKGDGIPLPEGLYWVRRGT